MRNFTRSLILLSAMVLGAKVSMAQTTVPLNTLGVIGVGSPGGDWTFSNGVNSLTRSTTNTHEWTGTLTMKAGEFKFRGNDTWGDYDWGGPATGSGFPSATGTVKGGNITATAGTYKVTFNDQTAVYSFAQPTATLVASAAALGLSLAPNPATEATSISYDLPAAAPVTLLIHNTLGQLVRQLPTVQQAAGRQSQQLSSQGLAAGVYTVQLQAGSQHQIARLLVN